MEGIAIFVGIVIVVMVGMWIFETVMDGVAIGVVKLVSAPFKAAGKARERNRLDSYTNGLYFDTVIPADQLFQALSAHYQKDEFHPANRVIVQTAEPGRFVLGIAWHEQVELHLENGQTARGSGLPLVVAEVTYGPQGAHTSGRIRLTRFPHDRGWAEDAVMENVFPWCLSPILERDPAAQLRKTPGGSAPTQFNSPAPVANPTPAPTSLAQRAPELPPTIARTANPAAGTTSKIFNAPPGWLVPAHNWQPTPDWTPDPSWPPAPAGWQFWR